MVACPRGCIWFPDCDFLNSRSTFHVFWQTCKLYLATSKNANLQKIFQIGACAACNFVSIGAGKFEFCQLDWDVQIWKMQQLLLMQALLLAFAHIYIGHCTYIYILAFAHLCNFRLQVVACKGIAACNMNFCLFFELYTFAVLPTHLQVLPLASLTPLSIRLHYWRWQILQVLWLVRKQNCGQNIGTCKKKKNAGCQCEPSSITLKLTIREVTMSQCDIYQWHIEAATIWLILTNL